MGGTHSSRKISVDNDEAVGVIRVSENVAQRLKNINNEGSGEKTTISNPQPQELVGNQNANTYQHNADGVYIPQPYLSTTMVRQQIERELEKNDQYWQKRVKTMQDHQNKITHILETEFNKAYNEAESKFPKLVKNSNIEPCLDYKSKIVDCLKSNANQTLNCSKIVNEFTTCITNSRSTQDSKARSP